MTIKECIDIVDNIKPNQYTVKEKVGWLSFIDEIIINDVLKTHEGYDGRYDDFEGYSEDKLSAKLIVPSPYDRLYTAYLKMKIDGENGEMARYNNSAELFNSYMMEYRKHYNKTHMPLDVTKKDSRPKPGKGAVTLPDSVIENIKRDLYAMLSEDVAEQTSDDRINAIVTSYMQTNAAMLKGKDGETPEKGKDYFDGTDGIGIAKISQSVTSSEDGGSNTILVTMTDGGTYRFYVKNGSKGDKPIIGVDYFTEADKHEIKNYIDEQTEIIKSDVEGLQAKINEESHFRGYLAGNPTPTSPSKATPNDFVYSATSGTKWVYDAENGWIDTGSPVPDQLTPASDTTPLINGVASVGQENAYARGDHRHPTDTTRASVEEVSRIEQRVSTNEQSIAGAFTYCGELDERVTTNEGVIGSNVARIIAVENKTSELESKADFELIESVEFTDDVVNVTPTIKQNYKELYMVFTIPTVNSDGSNTDKCRIRCCANNNKEFLVQGAAYVENYKEEWKLFIHAKFIANYIKGDIFHTISRTNEMGFAIAPSSSTQNGVIQPGFEMNEDYFNNLTIKMFDANGKQILRYFPSGTKYELWGVKK